MLIVFCDKTGKYDILKLQYSYTPDKTCTVLKKADRYNSRVNQISVLSLCCTGGHSTVPVHGTRDEELMQMVTWQTLQKPNRFSYTIHMLSGQPSCHRVVHKIIWNMVSTTIVQKIFLHKQVVVHLYSICLADTQCILNYVLFAYLESLKN